MTNAMSDKSTEGQAGAEITDEMIEAGTAVLFEYDTDDFARVDLGVMAVEVFEAMSRPGVQSRPLTSSRS